MQIFALCIFKFADLDPKLFINILSEAEKGQNLESCLVHLVLVDSAKFKYLSFKLAVFMFKAQNYLHVCHAGLLLSL